MSRDRVIVLTGERAGSYGTLASVNECRPWFNYLVEFDCGYCEWFAPHELTFLSAVDLLAEVVR